MEKNIPGGQVIKTCILYAYFRHVNELVRYLWRLSRKNKVEHNCSVQFSSFTVYYSKFWPSCEHENRAVEWRELLLLSKTPNKWYPWSSSCSLFSFYCCKIQLLQAASGSYLNWWYSLPQVPYNLSLRSYPASKGFIGLQNSQTVLSDNTGVIHPARHNTQCEFSDIY